MPFLEQTPSVGEHLLRFRGDVLDFYLKLEQPRPGKAYLRTNLGRGRVRQAEIIAKAERNHPCEGQDWRDLPMLRLDQYTYTLSLSLLDLGHFEAICFFEPADGGEIAWPGVDNCQVNIEPADYCGGNTIYCAFPRQFGPNKTLERSRSAEKAAAHKFKLLDAEGYAVIPPSGTFRSLAKELDTIVCKLKCRIIHLLPVNPTPTVYGRMGLFGSPYAALDFTAVDPALAEFDVKSTPLEQFLDLVEAIHKRNAKIIIDIAINHTGWASKLHETHPEWFVRRPDGTFVSPGAWGVIWGDLCELDHHKKDLWAYLSDVFVTWCARGVDGFRCDAGYMIPYPAWEYIIAKVRAQYPKTLFLLEGLGGDPRITLDLLNGANMNWAYSELFQNYSKDAIEGYLRHSHAVSSTHGVLVHYAETHDNNRLAATSRVYARMRTALCALSSHNGAFGFANGVEWFAQERIDVHQASGLNWGSDVNQIAHIARLNSILMIHPAFFPGGSFEFISSGHPNAVAFVRRSANGAAWLLCVINLDCEKPVKGHCSPPPGLMDLDASLLDLLTGIAPPLTFEEEVLGFSLSPGEAACVCDDPSMLRQVMEFQDKSNLEPSGIIRQRAKAVALDIISFMKETNVLNEIGVDLDNLDGRILDDPMAFCESVAGLDAYCPVVQWKWPSDLRRTVMIPPGHFLLVTSPDRFRVAVLDEAGDAIRQRDSLLANGGFYFAVLTTLRHPEERHERRLLRMTVFGKAQSRGEGPLLMLAPYVDRIPSILPGHNVRHSGGVFLSTNERGGMCRARLRWGELDSRYDCLLGANIHPEYPEDRRIMWTRARLWLQHRGRSVPFDAERVKSFSMNGDQTGEWEFHLPIGDLLTADVKVAMRMIPGENAVEMSIERGAARRASSLKDTVPFKIIIRPDLEDRTFHNVTKASAGPERIWPGAVKTIDRGFEFAPTPDARLRITAGKGKFQPNQEWYYSVQHKEEAERGLESLGDLFSPGYFEFELAGAEKVELRASISGRGEKPLVHDYTPFTPIPMPVETTLDKALEHAIKCYVVKRGQLKTVIAGYPWFLDWGRDTLICARGLIAAGMTDDVLKILLQFASFADRGTIPNMICGDNASNRDTSDAPLWLFTACADFAHATSSLDFLALSTRPGKTLLDELLSIAEGILAGAPNGVKADPGSLLVFSPPHFTWMDTNFPAGTPREGYPIEIQALWRAALDFLAHVTGESLWAGRAAQVESAIHTYFIAKNRHWLSDCLHCAPGETPAKAMADDHLRCNQLFAATLGAVKEKRILKAIVESSAELLVPGAIRTLADRPTHYHLPVRSPQGTLLNAPAAPYWGRYEGDEDTRRKPAYHNGTAWTWPFPSYCEAFHMLHGEPGRAIAQATLSSCVGLLVEGCLWHPPEILDGDSPHRHRGCDAQAWGATELYRVWKLLHANQTP